MATVYIPQTVFDYACHPAAELFPMMGDAELDELANDIRLNGQRSPIVLIDARGEWQIIDGRNRREACRRAGVKPKTTVVDGIADPVSYVLSHNLHRRHLTESQRGMIAARIANLQHGGNRRGEDFKGPIGPLNASNADAAERLQVGERTVKRAKEVLSKGAPELVAAVERGDVKVSAAAEVARLPREKQAEAVRENKVREVAKQVRTERAEPEPIEEEEWDEESATADASITITQVIRGWRGPSFGPLRDLLKAYLKSLESRP